MLFRHMLDISPFYSVLYEHSAPAALFVRWRVDKGVAEPPEPLSILSQLASGLMSDLYPSQQGSVP